MRPAMRLSDYKVLTFDCYGTLIDWESGVYDALQPLVARAGHDPSRDAVLDAFARHESVQQAETPSMRYPELLAATHRRIAADWGVAGDAAMDAGFGDSVRAWPAFADSAVALRYLKRHFKLVILSNVDRAGFARSNAKLGVAFDAIYTAEEIGSYKPDPANFTYMLARLKADHGLEPGDVLHTAQSLFHDHRQASAIGLATAWIDRRQGKGGGATPPVDPMPRIDFRFASLEDMAAAHRRERAAAQPGA